MIKLSINGREIVVSEQTSVAAAIGQTGITTHRRSVQGEPRAPLCGMGICGECRVTINGRPQQLGCQTLCAAGMEIQTDA